MAVSLKKHKYLKILLWIFILAFCLFLINIIIYMSQTEDMTLIEPDVIFNNDIITTTKLAKEKTIGLIIRTCGEDLYESLGLAYNLQNIHPNIPITIFWLDSNHSKFDYLIDKMNEHIIQYNNNIKFEKLQLFPFQVPYDYILPMRKSWFGVAWNKLSLWNKTEYDTIIYMDNDILITKDISELFNINSNGFTSHPSKHGFDPNMINGGFMIIKPDINVTNYLINYGENNRGKKNYFQKSEQSFLEYALMNKDNTSMMEVPIIMLSPIYNHLSVYCYIFDEEYLENDLIKVWHFAALPWGGKPIKFIDFSDKYNLKIDYEKLNDTLVKKKECTKDLSMRWMQEFIKSYKYIKPVYDKCNEITSSIDNFEFLNISVKKRPGL